MKKTLLAALTVLLALVSCCKDSGYKGMDRKTLDGTVWISPAEENHSEYVLKFQEGNSFELSAANGSDVRRRKGTYKYEYPYVWLSLDGLEIRGTILYGRLEIPVDGVEKVLFFIQW